MRTLANLPLRAKLLAVLALPVIAALALAAARINDGVNETSGDQQAVQAIQFDRQASALTDALQDERVSMATWLSGRAGERGRLDAAVAATDKAWRSVHGAVGKDAPSAVRSAERELSARMESLRKLRRMANDHGVTADATNAAYGAAIDTLLRPTESSGGAELRDRQNALQALATAKEDAALQNLYLELGAVNGKFKPADSQQLNLADADLVASIKRFNQLAPPQDQRAYTSVVTGAQVNNQFQLQQLATQRASANLPVALNPDEVRNNADGIDDRFRTVLHRTYDNVDGYAQDQLGSARTSLIITSAVVVLGLAITLALMFIIGRMMLRQLRTLRGTALTVANEQLPETLRHILSSPDPRAASRQAIEPVGVHTTEEIGQVARAFDEVHRQAVRQATDQALLRENVNRILVNLARRSQGLVQRELGVIDRLEEREQDPDRLTDLFELDHLATRLRRNGESLLVLSGAGPANQVTRPTRAADIIGAAVSETEEYRRIDVGTVPDVSVHGQAVHDLVHLLAELLDNATYFSEQSTPVHVRAAVTRSSELAVQITDIGVGMTAEQLDAANQQLAEPPDLDVSVTRRMGLYVVARLGERHGIEVRLRENEDIEGGTIARIVVPSRLLTDKARATSGLPPQVSVRQLGRQSAQEAEPAPNGTVNGAAYSQNGKAHVEDGTGASANGRTLFEDGAAQARNGAESPENGATAVPAPRAHDGTDDHGADDDAMTMVMPPDMPGIEAGGRRVELPELEAPLTLDSIGDGPIYTDQPSSVAQDKPVPEGRSSDQQRHEELVRKGTPIYQEMLSAWLSEPVEQANGSRGSGDWQGAVDSGWQAAAMLEELGAEPGDAGGLPKRVPNAYLVPGSMMGGAGTHDEENGEQSGERSAAAARERMARFQRGFLAGREALDTGASSTSEQTSAPERTGAPEPTNALEQTNPFGLGDFGISDKERG